MILACYAVKAFIGLRNSLVDGWIHGTSLLYKPAERKPRRLPWQRPVEEPTPSDWRSVLQAGYSEPQYQTFAARLTRGQPTLTPSAAAARLADSGSGKRRLSGLRVLVALVVLAGVGYGGYIGVKTRVLTTSVPVSQTWFAPYVDVTLTPTYQFQTPSQDPAQQSVLGFAVASSPTDCAPSWGASYSLTAANQQLAVGTRIAQLQQEGEQAVVSFGGQANTSLDVACTTAADLTAAYQSVISAYSLKTIDLDVEGAALDNFAAGQRRAAAMAALEKDDPGLSVWLTLPVEPDGLQDNAQSVIKEMLNDHVSIAGVNIMTMDFAEAPAAGSSMAASAEAALSAAQGQLAELYPAYGIKLKSQQVWQRIGATVMIGQNDIKGEIFTVSDAKSLVSFAGKNHLGRVSMWSINRDSQCGSLYSETGLLSNTCSGTPQSAMEFSQTLRQVPGHRAGRVELHRGAARRGRHQPGGRPLPAVERVHELPGGLQGRRERRDLPGQVVQQRRRPVGAGAVLLPDPLGTARAGGARRPRAGRRHAARRHLPGLVTGHPVQGRRQGALRGPALPGQVGQPGGLARHGVDRPVRLGVEGAVQRPRRAERRAGARVAGRLVVPEHQPDPEHQPVPRS